MPMSQQNVVSLWSLRVHVVDSVDVTHNIVLTISISLNSSSHFMWCKKKTTRNVKNMLNKGRVLHNDIQNSCLSYSIRPVYGAQHPPRVEKPADKMEHGTPKRHVQQRDSFQDFQVRYRPC